MHLKGFKVLKYADKLIRFFPCALVTDQLGNSQRVLLPCVSIFVHVSVHVVLSPGRKQVQQKLLCLKPCRSLAN